MSDLASHAPGPEGTVPPARRAGFADVLANGEFRALWLARLLSLIGDQVARVAVSLLVFERTGSAAVTALSFAMNLLPWIIGGPLLSGLADRWPRRSVMLVADLLRALLVLAAALATADIVPLAVPLILIFVTGFCTPPFDAARAALIPTIFTDDRYVLASALGNLTGQAAQVIGFAVGGGVVAALGVQHSLLLDALTFVASAALIVRYVQPRPASRDAKADGHQANWRTDLVEGARLIGGDPLLRKLFLLAGLASFLVVPEALAVPIAAEIGGGAVLSGLLLAALPGGTVAGGLILARFVAPEKRLRWIAPLAMTAGLPLIACAAKPGVAITLLLWIGCGLLCAYNLPANTTFMVAVPDRQRGQAIGVVQTWLAAGQGLGMLGAGVLADRFDPMMVIAGSGLIASLLALLILLTGSPLVSLRPRTART